MKHVLITGASGNLGTVVTQTLLEKGYTITALVHNEADKKAFADNDHLSVATADLMNEAETEGLIQKTIEKAKTIEAGVLLAGGFAMGNLEKTSTKDIQKQIALNFETAYHVVRPLFQHMLEQGYGRIILVGARPALLAAAGKNMIAYALSKSLLFRLAELLNESAKGKNVTVTVVVPSTIDTPPNRESMPDADPKKWVAPKDLAEIIAFILSNESNALRETVLKVYNES